MYRVGEMVIDRPTKGVARIQHVARVPKRHDIFGDPLPGHRRYTLVFDDGRWANDRTASDLEPVTA